MPLFCWLEFRSTARKEVTVKVEIKINILNKKIKKKEKTKKKRQIESLLHLPQLGVLCTAVSDL